MHRVQVFSSPQSYAPLAPNPRPPPRMQVSVTLKKQLGKGAGGARGFPSSWNSPSGKEGVTIQTLFGGACGGHVGHKALRRGPEGSTGASSPGSPATLCKVLEIFWTLNPERSGTAWGSQELPSLRSICLGFLPRSVWSKQTRIGPPFHPTLLPYKSLWPTRPTALWDPPHRLEERQTDAVEPLKTRPPLPNQPPRPHFLQKPSFLLSCPGAGPAAEAARASVYNYRKNPPESRLER